ncbi:MAG: hypothetical protein GWN71_37655, partial [Gammaproteobacteria bacterium]|nr:carboxypeptidase-like regulatory domain-containing protein [Gemmatimonadota bacterium]NIU79077.1 hypothetical protein [Gammaproteobacteria bacterium]NIX24661.1 hypothetical protein [Actinomycetota bacterium]
MVVGGVAPAAGQEEIRGTVAVVDMAEPIPGAAVLVSDIDGRVVEAVVADSLGEFDVSLPGVGNYLLRVYRVGFKPASSAIQVARGQTISVRVNLRPTDAVLLEGITVYGERVRT